MLEGIRLYTIDNVWHKVLGDLGAVVVDNENVADINFDSLNVSSPLSVLELKSIMLNEIDAKQRKIIKKVFGKNVVLPRLQLQIIVLLYQTGGMNIVDLKTVLGIAPDIATHTVDTAIYQLRKVYGREFIKNENGKYLLGV